MRQKVDLHPKIVYNCLMKTLNTEIYNYLNLINRRFGKMYKYAGINPLPKDFVIDQQKILNILLLNQMKAEDIFPPFINQEKKQIKKHFKFAYKNAKKLQKNIAKYNFSDEFTTNLSIYLKMYKQLCQATLRDFTKQSLDETAAYRDVYNINPVLGETFINLFDAKLNLEELLNGLEEKYNLSYQQKLKLIEKKNTKKQSKISEQQNLQSLQNVAKNSKNIGKTLDKTAKTSQKLQNKQDAAKTRQKSKQSKTTTKNTNKEK